jgi:tryptophan synthase alpha chain
MTRLAKSFEEVRASGRKALVAYLTAHDPSLDTSVEAALAAAAAGADILEIGVPFSDPVADGPVIQRAMGRALRAGGGLAGSLEVVRRIRARSAVPLVLFGYLNPLLWDGFARATELAATAGVDGLLVVDLPTEEADELRQSAAARGLGWVSLVAPTTGKERARRIAGAATGFLYMVSMTGVTGGALADPTALVPVVQDLRSSTRVPICIGFGIRDRQSARQAAKIADGVVVGSRVGHRRGIGARRSKGGRAPGSRLAGGPRRSDFMKHFIKLIGSLTLTVLGGCGLIFGEGKLFVWNGTAQRVIAVVDGRTSAELPLQPGSGTLISGATAGPYEVTIQHEDGSEKKVSFSLTADHLAIVNADAQSCFARTDISGMYQPGKPRVTMLESYPATEVLELDDIVHVFPGESAPAARPKSLYAFQRMYAVPCDLVGDDTALTENVRTQK